MENSLTLVFVISNILFTSQMLMSNLLNYRGQNIVITLGITLSYILFYTYPWAPNYYYYMVSAAFFISETTHLVFLLKFYNLLMHKLAGDPAKNFTLTKQALISIIMLGLFLLFNCLYYRYLRSNLFIDWSISILVVLIHLSFACYYGYYCFLMRGYEGEYQPYYGKLKVYTFKYLLLTALFVPMNLIFKFNSEMFQIILISYFHLRTDFDSNIINDDLNY